MDKSELNFTVVFVCLIYMIVHSVLKQLIGVTLDFAVDLIITRLVCNIIYYILNVNKN